MEKRDDGRMALYGTAAVVLAMAVNLPHGISHLEHPVPSPNWQYAYVAVVVYLAPIAAAGLLWTRFRTAGAWLLLVSMAASLVFGLAYHFLIPGPDNVSWLEPGPWRATFVATAVLGAIFEALGAWVGLRALGGRNSYAPTGTRSAARPR